MLRALVAVAVGATGVARAADVCDRACLQNYLDRYLAALVAHDPGPLPWARDVRYTENGQAGFIGTLFESGTPVLLALRLKVEEQTISEVETLVARTRFGSALPSAGQSVEDRGQPRPQFLRTVPEKERLARAELLRIANAYFTGLAANTGRNTAPFAATCNRWENGTQTTNAPRPAAAGAGAGPDILAMSCDAQQKSGFFSFVTSIRNRRFPVVDRERGLVLAFAFFEHAGRVKELHLTSGETVPSPVRAPTTLEIAELFQIDKGLIDQIEAVLNVAPYGMTSAAWDAR